MRRAVFLDRDGVLNEPVVRAGKPHPPSTLAEFRLYPEAARVCRALRDAGFVLLVVTNQPDVARGTQRKEVVETFHQVLRSELGVDDIFGCFHDDADRCECRKPRPGLLLAGAQHWDVDLAGSFLIGDRWRDVEAGRTAGTTTVFIDRGYAESLRSPPTVTVRSLEEAAAFILRRDGEVKA